MPGLKKHVCCDTSALTGFKIRLVNSTQRNTVDVGLVLVVQCKFFRFYFLHIVHCDRLT